MLVSVEHCKIDNIRPLKEGEKRPLKRPFYEWSIIIQGSIVLPRWYENRAYRDRYNSQEVCLKFDLWTKDKQPTEANKYLTKLMKSMTLTKNCEGMSECLYKIMGHEIDFNPSFDIERGSYWNEGGH